MKVSVVIPCYNAATYLRKCLDSVLEQSYSNFEVVCVDDASTDSTWEILLEYSLADSRVRAFQLEKNSGAAKYPRDHAVNLALSEWVVGVDSDDYIERDYLMKLVTRQQDADAQVVCARIMFKHADSSCDFSIPGTDFDMAQVLPGKAAATLTLGGWTIGMSGALISKNVWQSSSQYLNRDFLHMNADEYASREILIKAPTVAFADAHYYYRKHKESITHNGVRMYEALWTDIALVSLFRENYGTKSFEYKKVLTHFISSLANYTKIYNSYGDSPEEALAIIKKCHNSLSGHAILTSHVSWKRKLVTLLPFFLYRKLMRR